MHAFAHPYYLVTVHIGSSYCNTQDHEHQKCHFTHSPLTAESLLGCKCTSYYLKPTIIITPLLEHLQSAYKLVLVP